VDWVVCSSTLVLPQLPLSSSAAPYLQLVDPCFGLSIPLLSIDRSSSRVGGGAYQARGRVHAAQVPQPHDTVRGARRRQHVVRVHELQRGDAHLQQNSIAISVGVHWGSVKVSTGPIGSKGVR
jgi:hypothetical protein